MTGKGSNPLNRVCLVGTLSLVVFLLGCPPPVDCLRCGTFSLVGTFQDERITECSGMIASRKNPGILWVHNDSGDLPRLFAVEEDGTLRAVYNLEGAQAVDWEDMARGPCPGGENPDCLYVGDIGDNLSVRASVQLYRVAEPVVPDAAGPPQTFTLEGVERFDAVYPDGPRDAEVLLVDPATGIPYIVSKALAPDTNVYRFPGQPAAGETVTLEKVTSLAGRSFLTGGDSAEDGSRVILRGYVAAYDYPRGGAASFAEIFSQEPCLLALAAEPQGEALAISPSGLEVFTASEGLWAPIHKATCELP